MNQINKLIFNALSSHSGVNLPGVGAFWVERQPAKLKGSSKLTSPKMVIKFQQTGNEEFGSIIRLINRKIMDIPKSEVIYSSWLEDNGVNFDNGKVILPDTFVIESVGELKGNIFTSTKEIDDLLNPETGVAAITPRLSTKKVLIIIGVILAMLLAAYLIFYRTQEQRQHAYVMREVRKLEKRNLERAQKGMAMIGTEGSQVADVASGKAAADSAALKTALDNNESGRIDPREEQELKLKSLNAAASSETTYYIVMGVFSSKANAEKFIKEFSTKENTFTCKVVPISGDKFIVSGFESKNHDVITVRSSQLMAKYPDVWIYNKN